MARSWVYGAAAGEARDALDGLLLGLIDAPYTRRPFYGSRRRVVFLRAQGHTVNRQRVQRLMRVQGLAGMAPGPATSQPHPEHPVYPYRLRGVAVTRANHVWSTDITDIRLAYAVWTIRGQWAVGALPPACPPSFPLSPQHRRGWLRMPVAQQQQVFLNCWLEAVLDDAAAALGAAPNRCDELGHDSLNSRVNCPGHGV